MSSPYRIGVIGVVHETNSFAPGRTELQDFRWEAALNYSRRTFEQKYAGTKTSMGGVIDAAAQNQIDLVPGIYVDATPSGMVVKEAAETIMSAIVDSVDAQLDGLLVILHGAMVAEGYPDVEGELLSRVRRKVGAALPVSVTLDLHANISSQMVEMADLLVGYDTYPHIDVYERAIEAFELLLLRIRGQINPTLALSKPQLLIAPEAMLTEKGVFQEVMAKAFELEKDPMVINIVVAGGFPFSDVPDAGISFVVITDRDVNLARLYADELSDFAWRLRKRFQVKGLGPAAALQKASQASSGPVILIEGSDNVGGGSPGDATHVLQHLIDFPHQSLMVICDAEAAITAHEKGVGSTLRYAVGGKCDSLHGSPVVLEGYIRLLSDGKYKHVGPYMNGKAADMGRTAVIMANKLTLILTEYRNAPWDIAHISSLGLNPADYNVIVVKSALAWKTAFQSYAKEEIIIDSPGCCSFNLGHFIYRQISRPIYPLDDMDIWRQSSTTSA